MFASLLSAYQKKNGTRRGTRTPNLQGRNLSLCPIELCGHLKMVSRKGIEPHTVLRFSRTNPFDYWTLITCRQRGHMTDDGKLDESILWPKNLSSRRNSQNNGAPGETRTLIIQLCTKWVETTANTGANQHKKNHLNYAGNDTFSTGTSSRLSFPSELPSLHFRHKSGFPS